MSARNVPLSRRVKKKNKKINLLGFFIILNFIIRILQEQLELSICILNSTVFFWFSCQPGAAISDTHDGYWKHGAPSFQNHHVSTVQPDFQKHLDTKPSYDSFQDQQKTACPQGSNLQYPTAHKVSHSYQSPLQTIASLDTRRVNKLQIPTNPRIASNLALGLPKIDKDSSATGGTAKPAYIGVSVPKPSDKVLSHDGADAILKVRVMVWYSLKDLLLRIKVQIWKCLFCLICLFAEKS